MFNIPDNPYKHHPERKSIVRLRTGVFIGSVLCGAGSLVQNIHTPEIDDVRYYLTATTITSMLAATFSATKELQERLRSNGKDNRGRGGGWFVSDYSKNL